MSQSQTSAAVGRKAAVVGQPIAHSLSPVLHRAAFEALGLADWTYERIEADAEGLDSLLPTLDSRWVGLSVTMPGKHAALRLADSATERARLVGAANTLVRSEVGWHADCTDVDGVTGALREAGFAGGGRALLLGAGGTAAAAVAGLAELGVEELTVAVRAPSRASGVLAVAERLGVAARVEQLAEVDVAADVVVSTLPAGAADAYADKLGRVSVLLDVIYHPWPTVLAQAAAQQGAAVVSGRDMLLHQAFGQAEAFTGRPAPREAMRAALAGA